jgi:RNA recognition motif-containing protein
MQTTRETSRTDWPTMNSTSRTPRPLGNALEQERREWREQKSWDEPARATNDAARIYVGNLLYTVQMEDVQKLFEDSGYTV